MIVNGTMSHYDDPQELVKDDAGLLDGAGIAKVADYHDALRAGYDIDYRVITAEGESDLSLFTANAFAEHQVGQLSSSGRGLLLVIAPDQNKVRLEVGRNLEGIYTDAFVKYIENEQMIPFFRKQRVADGILATTEMIVSKAQEASAAFDSRGQAEPSTGAGAITAANIGVEDKQAPSQNKPDVSARGESPQDVVHAYIQAMAQGNDRPDLDIYTLAAQQMLSNWVVTKAQMRNVVRDHRKCTGESAFIQGDTAVVRYDAHQKVCSPYFLHHEDGEWRIDFAIMQKLIQFDQHNHWHMFTPNEFDYAFPELQPTTVNNNCRWCFTFGSEDLVIANVEDGSAADYMGLKIGDQIVEVDGNASPTMRWLFEHLYGIEEGVELSMTVLRDGYRKTFSYPAPPR